ncbi:MAG: TonB C-terminal domain-containing protein [Elusimicrobia bacterium]|nr:TonB C-terminal domain-containing protein [Elusimicrobiota bacterium]
MNDALRPYLTYSAAIHMAFVVFASVAVQLRLSRTEQVYRIDFIGSTATILNREQEAPSAAAPKAQPQAQPARRPPPQKDPDAFDLSRPRRPLPRPSVLESYDLNKPAEKPAAPGPSLARPQETPAAPAAAAAGAGAPGAGGGPTVSPDMPNFPFPWYLTTLRSALWDKWSPRMPQLAGECGVVFTILRDGSVVDLNIESSSGDGGFDYAAISAVREAAPFPPLPPGFNESFLKVHVQFKSGG